MKLSISKKLFLSYVAAVLLVSGSTGTYFYFSAIDSVMASLQGRLKNSAAMIAQMLDARQMEELRTEQDVDHPSYLAHLALIRELKQSNPDIAYLYVMRLDGEKVFFVLDSDQTERQALPGLEYLSPLPSLIRGFQTPSFDQKINSDQWGSFLSGYAPIKNGNGHYLVGVDMRADEVARKTRKLQISGVLSLSGSLLLAFICSLFLSSHFVRRIHLLSSQCKAIAQGQVGEPLNFRAGDEFDHLIKAFNAMSGRLAEARDENRTSWKVLERANEELERKVTDRTRELSETNETLLKEIAARKQANEEKETLIAELQQTLSQIKTLRGMLPICSSCKKIRDDKGYWNQIETYIRERSDADFSHGICPDCARRLYPEFYK